MKEVQGFVSLFGANQLQIVPNLAPVMNMKIPTRKKEKKHAGLEIFKKTLNCPDSSSKTPTKRFSLRIHKTPDFLLHTSLCLPLKVHFLNTRLG